MAGLEAAFRFGAADSAVVTTCIDAARRRARTLGVRTFRSRITSDTAVVEISANTYVVDIWLERLRRDLPTIAEATPCPRNPSGRRHLALGLVEILARYRGSLYDRYPEDWVPTLRARKQPIYLLPHELSPRDERLQDRLFVTMELMASWHYGEVAPPVLLEELHTAAELLLTTIVRPGARRMSFAELVAAARARGAFSPFPDDQRALATWRTSRSRSNVEEERATLLLELKDVRKRVRHRNTQEAGDWLDERFWSVAALLERLTTLA